MIEELEVLKREQEDIEAEIQEFEEEEREIFKPTDGITQI